jgi:hypothetical protein
MPARTRLHRSEIGKIDAPAKLGQHRFRRADLLAEHELAVVHAVVVKEEFYKGPLRPLHKAARNDRWERRDRSAGDFDAGADGTR